MQIILYELGSLNLSNCNAHSSYFGFGFRNPDIQSTESTTSIVSTLGPHCSYAWLQRKPESLSGALLYHHSALCKCRVQWPKKRHMAFGHCVQQQTQDSYNEEFRSSRSIALGLHQRYQDVLNGGFSNNLKEFITACVTAYAVGCTEGGLRKELLSAIQQCEDSSEEMQSNRNIGLRFKTTIQEVEECILWLSLVFITILCAPQPTIVRWSKTPAVSAEVQSQWRGFCAIIANAYYNRGMAWLPVNVLQLEQMAVHGHAEEASLVADRMRLVFATLECIVHVELQYVRLYEVPPDNLALVGF
ncbi:hypothetical protein O6H91_18G001800 [Diphasiastrum complanatum]|uniref:Uncharacterized protein n=1 Tax=Diphasiastrum complanatum TaxID=34168 RepID=A0ACC2AXG3_DIPCM|nr:hypothetical protein O6H91_18G001800 [Diphasiastrum complanatum]